MGSPAEPLSRQGRWYIYALHGYLAEMVCTTLILDEAWTFRLPASLLSLSVYGTCGLLLERIYLRLRDKWCLLTRCLLYTLCIYLWEFSTGSVLRLFGACPWDYSGFRYNFMGLVTLEYSLFWFVGSLLLEKLVISNALRLQLGKAWVPKEVPFPKFALRDN